MIGEITQITIKNGTQLVTIALPDGGLHTEHQNHIVQLHVVECPCCEAHMQDEPQ